MNFQRHSQPSPFSPSTENPFSPMQTDPMAEESQTAVSTAELGMDMDIDSTNTNDNNLRTDQNRRTSTTSLTLAASAHAAVSSQPMPGISLAAAAAGQRTTLTGRRAAQSPAFRDKLRQMALPLAPLVQLTTGTVHPAFPTTLLAYWLLTEAELESIAHFYHQRTPSRWTQHYPCPITWQPDMTLEEKRLKIGKFIGLQGCDAPRLRSEAELEDEARRARAAAAEEDALRRKSHWC